VWIGIDKEFNRMKLVTYSVVLNQHQAPVADELWELTNHQFTFVELINLGDTKGGSEDYSNRPYLIRAWESPEANEKAMVSVQYSAVVSKINSV